MKQDKTTCTWADIAKGMRETGILCESVHMDYAWDHVQFRKRPWWKRLFRKPRQRYERVPK